jgi:hypothetical protein
MNVIPTEPTQSNVMCGSSRWPSIRAHPDDLDDIRSVMIANNETVMKEMERRKAKARR